MVHEPYHDPVRAEALQDRRAVDAQVVGTDAKDASERGEMYGCTRAEGKGQRRRSRQMRALGLGSLTERGILSVWERAACAL